jgi:uracil-DNA glycosylase
MHARGGRGGPSNPTADMAATDDEIRERYLDRAIGELNELGRAIHACSDCPRGKLLPVLGSGHPQADIFLLKHSATAPEVEEGVAFYGPAGAALLKTFKRLAINPLAVYGTLAVKCPLATDEHATAPCRARVGEELAIVSPKIVVVMGADALADLNALELPLARDVGADIGTIQELTPTCASLYVPDIDRALVDEAGKRAFWAAIRPLGEWWAELPPY